MVSAITSDPTPGNNTYYQPTNVVPPAPTYSDVSIIKIDDSGDGYVGINQQLTYTLTVTNTAAATATDVVVSDTLDPNEVYVSSTPAYTTKTGQTLTWNLGSLAKSATQAITVTVSLGSATPQTGTGGSGAAYNPTAVTDPYLTFGGAFDLFNFTSVTSSNEAAGTFGDNGYYLPTGVTSTGGGPTPALSLTKVPTETSYNAVGQIIHYTLVATNTGNVTLTNVKIADPKLGTLDFGSATPPVILRPGESLTATGTHTVTLADLEAGKFDNTATATGKFGNQDLSVTASASVPADQTAALSLTKNAAPTTYDAVGQVITYTYVLKNTGNVTLTGPSR